MAYTACLNGVNGIPDTPSQHDLVKIFINKERTTWLSEKKDIAPPGRCSCQNAHFKGKPAVVGMPTEQR